MFLDPGTKNMTAPGAVGTSSNSGDLYPVRIFYASLIAAGTAGVLTLYNGSSVSGSPQLQLRALANSQSASDIENGLLFPSGCYADMTTGSMKVAISYQVLPA